MTDSCEGATCAIFDDEGFRGSVRAELATTQGREPTYVFRLSFFRDLEHYGVNISGVTFGNFTVEEGQTPCQLGGSGSAPQCMAEFLSRQFPTSLYSFLLLVGTYDDVANEPVALGALHLYLDPPAQTGPLHSLHCYSDPRTITISQAGTDTWMIDGTVPLTCDEYYVKAVPRPGKKGSDSQVKYEAVQVMRAVTAGDLNFKSHWTRN